MSDKIVTIQKRGTDQFHKMPVHLWEKMLKDGQGEYYAEVSAPEVPKEVAAKVALNKMSGPKTPESDNHGLQTTAVRLPDQNAGKVE